ncbi:hypothetical protein ACFZBU_20545 [Embleya sp. NPDC008237]|uniref:hypothetical protein n=1 Tax=Embleya sp. NPDC008237 TaxID=3363978 RepID=UPI0036E29162
MSRYRVQYANEARDALSKLSDGQRRSLERDVESSIGNDPYGCGSSPVKGNRDRRDVTVSGVFLRYEVSNAVLVVSVLRAQTF